MKPRGALSPRYRLAVLLLSLALVPSGAERARAIVTWIGGIGVEGLAVALALALHPGSRRPRRSL